MPHSRAATSTAGSAVPSGRGGVHSTRTGQPAMRAGTASMIAVDGSGAVPAGTYRPTAPSGTIMRSQVTPGDVSMLTGCSTCRSWNSVTVSMARRSAASCSRVRAVSAAANSAAPTANDSSRTRSSVSVYSRRAASPRTRTSATMRPARSSRPAASRCAGRRSRDVRRDSSSVLQSRISSAAVMAASSPPAVPAASWRLPPSGSRASPRIRSRGRRRAPPPCRHVRPAG